MVVSGTPLCRVCVQVCPSPAVQRLNVPVPGTVILMIGSGSVSAISQPAAPKTIKEPSKLLKSLPRTSVNCCPLRQPRLKADLEVVLSGKFPATQHYFQ